MFPVDGYPSFLALSVSFLLVFIPFPRPLHSAGPARHFIAFGVSLPARTAVCRLRTGTGTGSGRTDLSVRPLPYAPWFQGKHTQFTFSARMALRMAITATPTSANTAIHMVLYPKAPRIRKST